MKISVCMATYNGETYIREQIQSILSELGPQDELIISDDHSRDNTLNIVHSINDERIRVYLNEKEPGYARNFENAISKSRGDIIFLSDQDDVWVKGKVKMMCNALEYADLAISDACIVDKELKILNPSHFDLYGVKKGFWNNFAKTRYIGACMAFRKDMLKKLLPMPNLQEYCAHDYWITCVGEAYYRVNLVDIPLLLYRRHGGNASTGGIKSGNSLAYKLKVRCYTLYNLIKRRNK